MLKKFALLLTLLSAFGAAAHADEPIGGSYYVNNAVTGSITIVPATSNTNGLHVRTVAIACSANLALAAVPPGGAASRVILACNPTSPGQGIAELPFPLYLPAGYALFLSQGVSGSNQIYVTYDLNAGP